MLKSFVVSVFILLCFAIFESALLSNMLFLPAVPDFLLLCVLYISVNNGRLFGVSVGFVSGLFLDFLSLSPFGLNCLLRTVIGYCAGLFNKTLNLSGIFMPAVIGGCATCIKALILWIITLFYPSAVISYDIFSKAFCFELIANALLTPLTFKFLDIFSTMIFLDPENVS